MSAINKVKVICNCNKSKCHKEYCECYKSKIPCSIKCRCKDCNNSYGVVPDVTKIEIPSDAKLENISSHENNYCECFKSGKYCNCMNQSFLKGNLDMFLNKKRENKKKCKINPRYQSEALKQRSNVEGLSTQNDPK